MRSGRLDVWVYGWANAVHLLDDTSIERNVIPAVAAKLTIQVPVLLCVEAPVLIFDGLCAKRFRCVLERFHGVVSESLKMPLLCTTYSLATENTFWPEATLEQVVDVFVCVAEWFKDYQCFMKSLRPRHDLSLLIIPVLTTLFSACPSTYERFM